MGFLCRSFVVCVLLIPGRAENYDDLPWTYHYIDEFGERIGESNKGLSDYLSMFSNNVTAIYPSEFDLLIAEIGPDAFINFTSLKRLGLNGFSISEIDRNAFTGTQLESLDLGSNSLTSVPNLSVVGSTLRTLRLSNNRIRTMTRQSFEGLEALRILNLDRATASSFSYLPPDVFGNLLSLRSINLDGNNLEELPESLYELRELTDLSLNENQLHSLPDTPRLNQIQSMHLGHNNFSSVPSQAIYDMILATPFLHTLSIHNCGLQSFPDIRSLGNHFHSLRLNENPYVCNCELLWMKDKAYIKRKIRTQLRDRTAPIGVSPYVMRCTLPGESQKRTIAELSEDILLGCKAGAAAGRNGASHTDHTTIAMKTVLIIVTALFLFLQ